MKGILFWIFIFVAFGNSIAQDHKWAIVDGSARVHSVVSVPQKDAATLYRQANRWLVATFKSPEKTLTARIESEFLRGEGYQADVLKTGPLSSIDFRYTYTIEVKDGKARITLTTGTVLLESSQDTNSTHPLEHYLRNIEKRKKDVQSESILDAINTSSDRLINSFEKFLKAELKTADDW